MNFVNDNVNKICLVKLFIGKKSDYYCDILLLYGLDLWFIYKKVFMLSIVYLVKGLE